MPFKSASSMLSRRRTAPAKAYFGSSVPHPTFSAEELAPTYHDKPKLGCVHYSRNCKLRHPVSGRLYTCRLCCNQESQMVTKESDLPLDRYQVKEVLCMTCCTLQPASSTCVNPSCPSPKFASYNCGICNLYDSSDKSIYHCPYCNVCRTGQGLGIDYRHCMRCNACFAIDDDEHVCIAQTLEGNCPVCAESMFESTNPLRRVRCGHVLHLSCYNKLVLRGQDMCCPLCKKSMDDMSEHFALLTAAIKAQPMPAGYENARAKIYCQDCQETSETKFHFVGLLCECGSYNTREIQRMGC